MFQISLPVPAPDLSPGQGQENVLFLRDEDYSMGFTDLFSVQPDF